MKIVQALGGNFGCTPVETARRLKMIEGSLHGEKEEASMNIVQGYNPRRTPPQVVIRKVKGVLLIEKAGDDIYFYSDDDHWEVKRNIQSITQQDFSQEFKILAESYSELDGFYCINSITHTISYLGTQWDDVILGLKFRNLSA